MRIRERFNPRAPCGARLPPRQAPSSMPYFNPCAPCGARRRRFGVARAAAGFQPTRPLRGATPHVLQVSGVGCISTHAPLAGRDRIARTLFPSVSVFQPTRPLRGATVLPLLHDRAVRISTHAPLAGRDPRRTRVLLSQFISTHAPLAGRDHSNRDFKTMPRISTHAPLAGRDFIELQFLFIRPNFNPRAPCGARLVLPFLLSVGFLFQPTRPLRGATPRGS